MPNKILEVRPQAGPPIVGIVFAAIWEGIGYAQGVDFILAIPNSNLAKILDFSLGFWGALVFVVVCIVWLVRVMKRKPSSKRGSPWQYLLVAAIPAFALGAAFTATHSNTPRILGFYGSTTGVGSACRAIFDTSRLMKYSDDYRLHLVCGVEDPITERLDEKQLVFSNPFTITGGGVAVEARVPQELFNWFDTHRRWWITGVLIPEGHDMSEIKSLRDVTRNKGRLLNDYGTPSTTPNPQ